MSNPPKKRAARREATQFKKHVEQHDRNASEVNSGPDPTPGQFIVSALLANPELYSEHRDKIHAGLFLDRDTGSIWRAIEALDSADDLTVRNYLKQAGDPAADRVLDLSEEGFRRGTGAFGHWLKVASDEARKAADIELARRLEAFAKDGDLDGARQLLESAEEGTGGDSLQSRAFDARRRPDAPEPIFTLGGKTIATPGNIQVLTGREKAGKSRILSAMLASTFGAMGDTLCFKADNRHGKQLVYLDCEQSEFDFDRLIRGALRRAKIEEPPSWFSAYHFTGMTPEEIRLHVRRFLRDAESGRGTFAIVIDGFADMVRSPNDEEETFELVRELHELAIRHKTAIMGVLHQNPGTEKGRGHLGSQLQRKAETVIQLDREGETIFCHTSHARGAPIFRGNALRFGWDDDIKDFSTMSSVAEVKLEQKADQMTELMLQIAEGDLMKTWRHGELVAALSGLTGKSESTAKRWVQDGIKVHAVNHDPKTGFYRLGSKAKQAGKSAANAEEQGGLEL